MALGDVAAKIGLPVFPCGSNKRPVVKPGSRPRPPIRRRS